MRKNIKKLLSVVLSAAMLVTMGGIGSMTSVKGASAATTYPVSKTKAKAYHAYMMIQSQIYIFRNGWYDGTKLPDDGTADNMQWGLGQTTHRYYKTTADKNNLKYSSSKYSPLLDLTLTSAITRADSTTVDVQEGGTIPVKFQEVYMDKAGTYSLKLTLTDAQASLFAKGLTDALDSTKNIAALSSTGNFFQMIGIATDIPRKVGSTSMFSNLQLYIDGSLVKTVATPTVENYGFKDDPATNNNKIEQKGSGDYWTPMLVNAYSASKATDGTYPYSDDYGCNKFTYPKKSIELRFTINADAFDSTATTASDSDSIFNTAVANAKTIDSSYVAIQNNGITATNADGSYVTQEYEDSQLYSVTYNSDGTVASKSAIQGATLDLSKTSTTAAVSTAASGEGIAVGKTFTTGGVKYKVIKQALTDGTFGTVAVAGTSGSMLKAKEIEIGSTVMRGTEVYKITTVNANAFKKSTKLTSVILGKYAKTLAKSSFASCKKLKNLYFNAKLSKVKSGAFKGCKKKISVAGTSASANVKKLKKCGYKKFKVDDAQYF